MDRKDFDDGVTRLTFYDRKMYEGYPDVDEFKAFLEKMSEQDEPPYQYIEIGEDGQHEEYGDNDFGMYISVSVHSDYDY